MMAEPEPLIFAPENWLSASTPAISLITELGKSLITTPDVYTTKTTTSGSDYIVIAVIAIIVMVLFLSVYMVRTQGKVRT
jgi:hypothetical protein